MKQDGAGAPAVAEERVPAHHGLTPGAWVDRTAMDQESDDGEEHPPESHDRLPVRGLQDIVEDTTDCSGIWAGSPQGRGEKPHTYAVARGNWGGNWAGNEWVGEIVLITIFTYMIIYGPRNDSNFFGSP